MKRKINVKIDDSLTVECRELSLGQVMGLVSKLDPEKMPDVGLFDYIKNVFSNELIPLTTDIDAAKLLEFSPSEIAAVYVGVKEANKDFFTMAATLNLPQIVAGIVQNFLGQALEKINSGVLTNTGELSVPSESVVTPTALNTDIPTP